MIPGFCSAGSGGGPPTALLMAASVWLDASDAATVTLSGSDVTDWASKASALSVTQSNGSLRPNYTATINGKNVVTFATNDYLANSSAALLKNVGGWTVYIVVKPAQNTSLAHFMQVDTNVAAARAAVRQLITSGFWAMGGRRGNGDAFASNDSSTQVGTGVAKLVTAVADFSTTTATLYLNRVQIAQNTSWLTSGVTDNNGGGLTMGNSGALTAPYSGDIAEFLIYGSAQSAANQDSVNSYLMTKWGL